MEEKELLSVIVPVFNVSEYIDKCLESIVNQSYTELEIILVDDGSTDLSGKICDDWAAKDKRIRVIHIANHGVSYARNLGKKQSSGSWITFVDPDDWIEDSLYSKAMSIISVDESIDILFWDYSVYKEGKLVRPNHFLENEIDFHADDLISVQCKLLINDSRKMESYYALRSPVTEIIKRRVACSADFPEDIYMGEDTCYILQCIGNSFHIHYMNYSGYVYRIQDSSVVHSFQKRRAAGTEQMSMWLMEYAKRTGIKQMIYASYVNHVHNIIAILNYYLDFNIRNVISNNECEFYIKELADSEYYHIVKANIGCINVTLKERILLAIVDGGLWKLLRQYKKIKLLVGNINR